MRRNLDCIVLVETFTGNKSSGCSTRTILIWIGREEGEERMEYIRKTCESSTRTWSCPNPLRKLPDIPNLWDRSDRIRHRAVCGETS